ncbi:unnamed protein product [Symbiodinium natans]|uniref:Uncharacterized protein n=1 Tax=Symbiodinium natans TaxID=878477 RepID=A0A812UFC6_9DINO|nr:unnamed protein product [Symbiodinium natans]
MDFGSLMGDHLVANPVVSSESCGGLQELNPTIPCGGQEGSRGASFLLGSRWHQRCRSLRRSRLQAVVDKDEHVLATRRWLDEVVIGYNFCPYAGPTEEARQIRIVASSARSPEGVLEDLSMEATRLPTVAQKSIEPGQPATTLLVCPHVMEWESFDDFRAFYESELANGYIYAEQDLYIVYFHPSYGQGTAEPLREGDVVDLGGDAATVLDTAAGFGASGQPLAKVSLASGEESFIELPVPPDHTEQIVSCAPRPALHLLRTRDLEEANDAEIHRRNTDTIATVGEERIRNKIERCG